MNNCNNKKLRPLPPLQVLQNFPFMDYDFDAATNWEIMQKMTQKIDEIVCFINNIIEQSINEYIDKRFNDIMLNSMYDAETETLILYLKKESDG